MSTVTLDQARAAAIARVAQLDQAITALGKGSASGQLLAGIRGVWEQAQTWLGDRCPEHPDGHGDPAIRVLALRTYAIAELVGARSPADSLAWFEVSAALQTDGARP